MKLVLLPGMDGTGELFEPLVRSLPPSLEPVVVTYPPDRPLSYNQLEKFVRPKLPASEPFAILGESFSGPIAISLAASASANLKALVLSCTFAKNPHPRFAAIRPLIGAFPAHRMPSILTGFVMLGSESSEERRASLGDALQKVAPKVLRTRVREVLAVDVTRQLAKIAVPALYLRAKQDRVVPRSALEEIQRHMPNVQVAEIDSPHFLLQVNPTAAAAVIANLLAR